MNRQPNGSQLITCRFQYGATDWVGAPPRIGAPNKRPPRRLLRCEPHCRHCRRREAVQILVSSPGTGRRPETPTGVHLSRCYRPGESYAWQCIIGDSSRRDRIGRPLPERRTRRRPAGHRRRTRKRSIYGPEETRGEGRWKLLWDGDLLSCEPFIHEVDVSFVPKWRVSCGEVHYLLGILWRCWSSLV
jgi:hypothetical protein